ADPVRIELFGDEIESIRVFDVESQRKVTAIDKIAITILSPSETSAADAGSVGHDKRGHDERGQGGSSMSPLIAEGDHVLDAVPTGTWVVLVEMEEVIREGRQYLDR